MFAALLLATLVLAHGLCAEDSRKLAPSYSLASIVNAASNIPGNLAPNTLATIYGANLSYSTRGISSSDIRAGALPVVLDGVRVYVGYAPAPLYYVSPTQINFLIPVDPKPGEH